MFAKDLRQVNILQGCDRTYRVVMKKLRHVFSMVERTAYIVGPALDTCPTPLSRVDRVGLASESDESAGAYRTGNK